MWYLKYTVLPGSLRYIDGILGNQEISVSTEDLRRGYGRHIRKKWENRFVDRDPGKHLGGLTSGSWFYDIGKKFAISGRSDYFEGWTTLWNFETMDLEPHVAETYQGIIQKAKAEVFIFPPER